MEGSEKRITFDDVFALTGGTGWFQLYMFVAFSLVESAGAAVIYYFVFDAGNPGWFCPNPNITFPENGSLNFVQGYCVEGKPCANFTFDKKYTSIVTEWTLICDDAYVGKVITSLFFVGVFVGALVISHMADKFGRKLALMTSWFILIVGNSLTVFAPTWPVYCIIRSLSGIGAGGLVTISTVLMSEYIAPKWRACLANRLGWQTGPLIYCLVGYLLRDWKKQSLVMGLWSTPFLVLSIFLLPESARWLMQKKRFSEAEHLIEKMAKMNRQPSPNLVEIRRVIEHEVSNLRSRQTYHYLDLFYTKTMAKQSAVLLFGWFSIAVVSYGVKNQMSTLSGSIYLNVAILSFVRLGTRWTNIFIINLVGRRKGYPLFVIIVCVILFTVVILDFTVESSLPKTILVITAEIISPGGWTVLLLYSTELYPTLMRSVSTGAGNMAARIAGIVAPQISLLVTFNQSLPYVVFGLFALTSSILIPLVLPETTGQPLPDEFPRKRKEAGNSDRNDSMHAELETIELA